MKHVLLILLLITSVARAQTFHLSSDLSEISGIEFLNDTTIAAINDGGHEPWVYLLSLEGKIRGVVKIENATNRDWEDLAVDDEHLYIGDIGNNTNARTDLAIYKVKINDLLQDTIAQAEKITFNYKEQTAFPPERDGKYFDAEALAYDNDSLYIFTKNRARPKDGNAWVYKLPVIPGDYSISKMTEIYIGLGGMWADALTAADIVGDEFFLMTYNRVIIKKLVNGEFVGDENINFKTYSQKEALLVKSKLQLYVADEYRFGLGGPRLYYIEVNDKRGEE